MTGLLFLKLKSAHLTGNDEVAVVKVQRARNAVLEHFKSDRIDWCPLSALCRAIEVADRYRPSRHAGE